jgi:hypothetical protein
MLHRSPLGSPVHRDPFRNPWYAELALPEALEDPGSKQRRPALWQQKRFAIAVVVLVIMYIVGFNLGYFDQPGDGEAVDRAIRLKGHKAVAHSSRQTAKSPSKGGSVIEMENHQRPVASIEQVETSWVAFQIWLLRGLRPREGKRKQALHRLSVGEATRIR